MGFSRQLTPDEIFEQVARFSSELAREEQEDKKIQKQNGEKNESSGKSKRLSNIVFMVSRISMNGALLFSLYIPRSIASLNIFLLSKGHG